MAARVACSQHRPASARLLKLKAAALAACSLVAPAAAQVPQDSRAPCSITDVFDPARPRALGMDIAAQVASYVCGSGNAPAAAKEPKAEATRLAEDVSVSVALEAAPPVDSCSPRSTIRGDGFTIPSNTVRAIAGAFSESMVLGAPATCRPCKAAAAQLAEEFEMVYVDAVSEAELELQRNFGPLIVPLDVFVEEIVDDTAAEFATALVQAQAAVGGICSAAAACPEGASAPADRAPDRTAAVVSVVISDACKVPADDVMAAVTDKGTSDSDGDKQTVASEVDAANPSAATATVLAGRMAAAIGDLSGGCAAVACDLSGDDFDSAAAEVTSIFSATFAAAREVCAPGLCKVTERALTAALADALSEGAASVVRRQCRGQPKALNEARLAAAIAEATSATTSAIISQVTVAKPASRCRMPGPAPESARAPAAALPDCFRKCTPNNNRCFGSATRFGDTPAECCDPTYVCMRRNARVSHCRPAASPVPRGWDGRIETCRKPKN